MSAAQFTPGPWQSKDDYTIAGATTIIANIDGEIHPDGSHSYTYEFIATCEDEYGERCERAQANARLIIAAPKLYAALAEMLPSNVCLTNSNVPNDTVVPTEYTMGDLRRISAILTQAGGAQ